MGDCYSCKFAKRDDHGRYIEMCSGFPNCSYEKYTGYHKDTLGEYIERLTKRYKRNHKKYSPDYLKGVMDCLSLIKYWDDTE